MLYQPILIDSAETVVFSGTNVKYLQPVLIQLNCSSSWLRYSVTNKLFNFRPLKLLIFRKFLRNTLMGSRCYLSNLHNIILYKPKVRSIWRSSELFKTMYARIQWILHSKCHLKVLLKYQIWKVCPDTKFPCLHSLSQPSSWNQTHKRRYMKLQETNCI